MTTIPRRQSAVERRLERAWQQAATNGGSLEALKEALIRAALPKGEWPFGGEWEVAPQPDSIPIDDGWIRLIDHEQAPPPARPPASVRYPNWDGRPAEAWSPSGRKEPDKPVPTDRVPFQQTAEQREIYLRWLTRPSWKRPTQERWEQLGRLNRENNPPRDKTSNHD